MIMTDCPQLRRLLNRTGHDCTDSEHELLRSHIEQCSVCQAQFERLVMVASVVRAGARPGSDPDEHPSALELATFAEQGSAAEHAEEIIEHLSHCRQCREAVTTARSVLHNDELHSENDDPPYPSPSLLRRGLCGLGALTAFFGEWLLLGVAGAWLVLAWLSEPIGATAVPDVWPLVILPDGPLRLWGLVTACVIGALPLRWVAGRLSACARLGPEGARRRPPMNRAHRPTMG
jgi:hypothetical protein